MEKEEGMKHRERRGNLLRIVAVLLLATLPGTSLIAQECTGDCNGDGRVTVDEVVRGVNIGLGSLPLSECPAMDADGSMEISIDELIRAVLNGLEGCPPAPETLAFVVGTDFQSGGFATLSLDPPHEPSPLRATIQEDAVPRVFGSGVYIVNRSNGSNIQRLDPGRGFDTDWQCSTGDGSNPQDVVILDESKGYITRLAERGLLVINPSPSPDCRDFQLGEIDLSEFADDDGFPEMDQMALVDGILYVSLQRLANFAPAGPGKIVGIDTSTDTVVRDITLSGENPFAATKGLVVRGGAILVAQVGSFGVLDGGIERVDLASGEAEGFFITEEALGGDINDFAIVSDQLGYAIVGALDFTTSLVRFNPSAGMVTGIVIEGAEFVADIELNDRGELYVLDRTFTNPGVRVFRADDATEITTAPINIGLPPFQVVFLR
jgi:hypothetical protein